RFAARRSGRRAVSDETEPCAADAEPSVGRQPLHGAEHAAPQRRGRGAETEAVADQRDELVLGERAVLRQRDEDGARVLPARDAVRRDAGARARARRRRRALDPATLAVALDLGALIQLAQAFRDERRAA